MSPFSYVLSSHIFSIPPYVCVCVCVCVCVEGSSFLFIGQLLLRVVSVTHHAYYVQTNGCEKSPKFFEDWSLVLSVCWLWFTHRHTLSWESQNS